MHDITLNAKKIIATQLVISFFFNPQQVGIDKGDIPDLTQVSVWRAFQ